jgi:hypothetical protein
MTWATLELLINDYFLSVIKILAGQGETDDIDKVFRTVLDIDPRGV